MRSSHFATLAFAGLLLACTGRGPSGAPDAVPGPRLPADVPDDFEVRYRAWAVGDLVPEETAVELRPVTGHPGEWTWRTGRRNAGTNIDLTGQPITLGRSQVESLYRAVQGGFFALDERFNKMPGRADGAGAELMITVAGKMHKVGGVNSPPAAFNAVVESLLAIGR